MSLTGPPMFQKHKLVWSGLHHTGLWKCEMPWTKEIPEDPRKIVIDAHQAEKGCKTISKQFVPLTSKRDLTVWNGQVQTLTQWKCCGRTWKEQFMQETPNTMNITELKQFSKEEWARLPPPCCSGLITSYWKFLDEVIADLCLRKIFNFG